MDRVRRLARGERHAVKRQTICSLKRGSLYTHFRWCQARGDRPRVTLRASLAGCLRCSIDIPDGRSRPLSAPGNPVPRDGTPHSSVVPIGAGEHQPFITFLAPYMQGQIIAGHELR